ncbi:hypothetical protein P170DRAFT_206609 [Aspergillus steynii IBT 23096]|uniref:Uncharacterized protein n=1 Tax=Aspergillus steynii IBT 23096 TaxID=1392250 RepID=A0A2I2G5I0_9EURO|nr:uncharacterized protein P170DRAFT_206609 [Aspergillus steynii IBT 23096]PLB48124.1 hypothetical protein P170DRAFT_206609 [Aspergillus steynii IBT 23096]
MERTGRRREEKKDEAPESRSKKRKDGTSLRAQAPTRGRCFTLRLLPLVSFFHPFFRFLGDRNSSIRSCRHSFQRPVEIDSLPSSLLPGPMTSLRRASITSSVTDQDSLTAPTCVRGSISIHFALQVAYSPSANGLAPTYSGGSQVLSVFGSV